MSFLLNYGPIIASSFATILGVFGDCTRRDANGHFNGLLRRGKWSLAMLLIALGLSVGKQIHDNDVEDQRQAELRKLSKTTEANLAGVGEVSTKVESVSTGVSGVRSGVDQVSTKVDVVSGDIAEIKRQMLKLGGLIALAQTKGELPIQAGDALADKRLFIEVRGERVYDMESVLAEIERLKKETGVTGGEALPHHPPAGERRAD